MRSLPDLSQLACSGNEIAVRVTPRARRNAVEVGARGVRVLVTCPPEGGQANRAVVDLLARSLGLPKSRLVLLRGARARDKVFRVD